MGPEPFPLVYGERQRDEGVGPWSCFSPPGDALPCMAHNGPIGIICGEGEPSRSFLKVSLKNVPFKSLCLLLEKQSWLMAPHATWYRTRVTSKGGRRQQA